METVAIGDATLFLGDGLAILPTLPRADAVVTDPPYGLGKKWGTGRRWSSPGLEAKKAEGKLWNGMEAWDASTIDGLETWLFAAADIQIVWGGNYYAFPPRNSWLIWDKAQKHSGSECEMAWTNLSVPVRKFVMSRVEAYTGREGKQHPTEKPLRLMEWCLAFIADAESIADPFMGSGTTGVACINLGRKFTGIEIERKYFDIACERIEAAYSQKRLFA